MGYKTQKYLAYFQAYTNTYADIELVKELYTENTEESKELARKIKPRTKYYANVFY